MNKKLKSLSSLFLLLCIIALIVLWQVGLLGLWKDGIAYIANNTEKYSDREGHKIQGRHSLSIDLSDLNSNRGKELYNDGTHKIVVASVEKTINDSITISFRSMGHYSLNGATLISGVRHYTVNNISFASEMSAVMTAEDDSTNYSVSGTGMSGLNYRDGDDFSFSIYPLKTSDGAGKLQITLTNLYLNAWNKK